ERDDALEGVAEEDERAGAQVEAGDRSAENHGPHALRCDLGDRADDDAAERDADEVGGIDADVVEHVEDVAAHRVERVVRALSTVAHVCGRAVAAQVHEQHVELFAVCADLTEPDCGAAARAMHEHDPGTVRVEDVGPVVQHHPRSAVIRPPRFVRRPRAQPRCAAGSASTSSIMRWRVAASGRRPMAPPRLSRMWRAWLVAGVMTVTAGWAPTNLRETCAHDGASKSCAHSGTVRSPTRLQRRVRPKGAYTSTPIFRSCARGRIVFSASRLSIA